MRLFIICCLICLVCACSNIRKEDLGLARLSPNEKLVEQRQPLVFPSAND
ncbi:MAG: hypothetical protein IKA30_02055 [Alphaproteobacteria bacterium]|nr:hypothetical protein [Alphaproteobacteria bacterium]